MPLSSIDQVLIEEFIASELASAGPPYRWEDEARPNQLPPPEPWIYWLLLAGRGFGKTRTAMELVRQWAQEDAYRIALVGSTNDDTRRVMVEGESGLLAVCERAGVKVEYRKSSLEIHFPETGAMAIMYSAEEPNRLRGPQHHKAAADEIAAWKRPETWDMLQFGLRLGENPQCVVATTPRPVDIVKELLDNVYDPIHNPEGYVRLSFGSTYDNLDNLAPAFINTIVKKYEGTRLGRQELHAELLLDTPGALWNLSMIEKTRIKDAPEPIDRARIVVAVDPMTGEPKKNAFGESISKTGIVVAMRDHLGAGYVLEDASMAGSPQEWAARVVRAYREWEADRVVAEINQGGLMVEQTLRSIDAGLPITLVHASRGKLPRAEPISALYEQGKIHHVGFFPELESQMTTYSGSGDSPDNMDAMVWAMHDLMVNAAPSEVNPDLLAAFVGLPGAGPQLYNRSIAGPLTYED